MFVNNKCYGNIFIYFVYVIITKIETDGENYKQKTAYSRKRLIIIIVFRTNQISKLNTNASIIE